MIKIAMIRHGKTYGNTLGRYIGVTDEPLCEEGKKELEQRTISFRDFMQYRDAYRQDWIERNRAIFHRTKHD